MMMTGEIIFGQNGSPNDSYVDKLGLGYAANLVIPDNFTQQKGSDSAESRGAAADAAAA